MDKLKVWEKLNGALKKNNDEKKTQILKIADLLNIIHQDSEIKMGSTDVKNLLAEFNVHEVEHNFNLSDLHESWKTGRNFIPDKKCTGGCLITDFNWKGERNIPIQVVNQTEYVETVSDETIKYLFLKLKKASLRMLIDDIKGNKINVVKLIIQKDKKMSISTDFRDLAMMGLPGKEVLINQKEELGGINLDSSMLNLKIKRDGNGVPLPVEMQDMDAAMQVQGFRHQILFMQPVNMMGLLGLADSLPDEPSAHLDQDMVARDPMDLKA